LIDNHVLLFDRKEWRAELLELHELPSVFVGWGIQTYIVKL
jgi:hypothetical protein